MFPLHTVFSALAYKPFSGGAACSAANLICWGCYAAGTVDKMVPGHTPLNVTGAMRKPTEKAEREGAEQATVQVVAEEADTEEPPKEPPHKKGRRTAQATSADTEVAQSAPRAASSSRASSRRSSASSTGSRGRQASEHHTEPFTLQDMWRTATADTPDASV